MTNQELAERNRGRRIFQIGFVTSDLKKSMDAWINTLGVGPWAVLTFTEETMKDFEVNGVRVTEPFKFLIGATKMGDMQIELIQPVYGPSHLADFLREKGEGFHHIKEQVTDDDIPSFLAALKADGASVLQTGKFGPDVHFHLDTNAKLDFVYEIGNCLSVDVPPSMISIYPVEGR